MRPASFGLGVALLLAAILVFKANQPSFRYKADLPAIGRDLAIAAGRAGYATRIGGGGADSVQVDATLGRCTRHLFAIYPDGAQVTKIARRFSGRAMTFHFGTLARDRLPRPWPLVAAYAQGYAATFGIVAPLPPLIAEVSGPECRSAPPIRFDRIANSLS